MRFRLAALLGALVMLSTVLVGCAPDVRADGVIHVPAEVKTLVEAEQKAEPGDLVAVFQSGAYGVSASPQAFLGHPAVTEVLV